MHFLSRLLSRRLILAALLSLGSVAPVASAEPDPAGFRADLAAAAGVIAEAGGMSALMAACPADIFRQRMPWYRRLIFWREEEDMGAARCRRDIPYCVKSCVEGASAAACFRLARLFEEPETPDFDIASRRAFALSCALGYAGGCTNRGAGIRNAPMPEDPPSEDQSEETMICLRRSFALACDWKNSWGCAMEGQALRLGEGGSVDLERARVRLNRACALSAAPEGKDTARAPCRFARRHLEQIDNRE